MKEELLNMNLLEKINNDMKDAMRNKDSFKLSVIRMVKGAIQLDQINKKRDLTEEEIIDIVNKQIKLRKDSIVEFSKANRNDLVEQNQKEIDLLINYMPKQLTEEEILKIIDEAFDLVKPTNNTFIGPIMKEVTPKVRGKADMGLVNSIIKDKLNNL